MNLTPDNCRCFTERPPVRSIVRILSEGFCALGDGNIQEIITKAGCEIISERESDSVGTWTGGMRELIYLTPDGPQVPGHPYRRWPQPCRMHMYVIVSQWQEEWITSLAPLDWSTAADLIQQGRRFAFPLSYPAETD